MHRLHLYLISEGNRFILWYITALHWNYMFFYLITISFIAKFATSEDIHPLLTLTIYLFHQLLTLNDDNDEIQALVWVVDGIQNGQWHRKVLQKPAKAIKMWHEFHQSQTRQTLAAHWIERAPQDDSILHWRQLERSTRGVFYDISCKTTDDEGAWGWKWNI